MKNSSCSNWSICNYNAKSTLTFVAVVQEVVAAVVLVIASAGVVAVCVEVVVVAHCKMCLGDVQWLLGCNGWLPWCF